MIKAQRLSHNMRYTILALISVIAVSVLALVGPIPQDPHYHLFADSQQIAGINHFWNVASNLPFLLVGILGLYRYPQLQHKESSQGYLLICVGTILVSLGSSYYHYEPTNQTLFWDRLPMTVTFMALISLLINERVNKKPQPHLLWWLIAVGVASVLYWAWSESIGQGDLRPYALVQFLPIALIPLILIMFPQRYLNNKLLVVTLCLYFIAKALEHFDAEILSATGFMGGHAIKHVAAALATGCVVYANPTKGE
jgi:predicted membrane channel-forming protein YqfA (hemolysin III family)